MKYEDREKYDQRHGGPFDRGSADSWYSRGFNPHYFLGGTHTSHKVEKELMTPDQVEAYKAGFYWNEQFGDKKCWD